MYQVQAVIDGELTIVAVKANDLQQAKQYVAEKYGINQTYIIKDEAR